MKQSHIVKNIVKELVKQIVINYTLNYYCNSEFENLIIFSTNQLLLNPCNLLCFENIYIVHFMDNV